ncbi:shikimate dehydrogenase [Nocardiopsis sp. RV163]|uniref:shikimate dehydrogenase family protein n=1 Tax=Nocardiopsis sp. RV163 TaxID=1661388 RepID=UPI000AC0D01B|nr:shikimate dehydrogenase [Nocardiopsis sp. RV163]
MSVAISGRTRVLAVLGDPVEQAGSPALMNAAFGRWGVDAVLVPLHVPAADLPTVLEGLRRAANVDGLCVTVPHKPAALRLVGTATGRAVRADGVNVIRRGRDGGWHGDALDGVGMLDGLREQGAAPEGLRAWMVGAGGVGRALAAALLDAGVASLEVYDADPSAVAELLERLGPLGGDRVTAAGRRPGTGVDLAVNASPLGTRADDPPPFDPGTLRAGAAVVDVALGPGTTPLVAGARAHGHPAVCGRTMLARQIDHYRAFFFPEQV